MISTDTLDTESSIISINHTQNELSNIKNNSSNAHSQMTNTDPNQHM